MKATVMMAMMVSLAATASVAGTGGTAYYITTEAKQDAELKAQQHAKQVVEPKAAQGVVFAGEHATINTVGPVTWVSAQASTPVAAPTTEDLGQQVIEGVPAKGTRTTSVIPAGITVK